MQPDQHGQGLLLLAGEPGQVAVLDEVGTMLVVLVV